MTRPEIVRADTIDLQDASAPSAKDHTRQPSSPKPLGDGPPAPHQAQSLRKASLDGYDLHVRSPRASKDLSDKELQLLHDTEPDEHDAATENEQMAGGLEADGHDMGGDDDDDDMDDDMMDKISSSPSIDDGGYNAPILWPRRKDSLMQLRSRLGVESMSFELERPQLRRAGSKIQVARSAAGSSSSEDDYNELEGNVYPAHPGHRPASLSRFKENFEDSDFDLDESDLDALEDSSDAEDFQLFTHDSLFDLRFDDHVPYEFEVNDLSDLGEEDDLFHEDDDMMCPDALEDEAMWTEIEDRFVDSGWGGECLRETEDIDFEFVYALHTFVATVEGQANATKGDTMVLLDDSNSYWWLVKVVKDSSIGYLPAEHIETPTERLARLNKHRNIDLSQTMLGDNPEKSRNPLKKAMRKRNAKTVQFTDPQYFEPSEPSYSSDEEDDLMSPGEHAAAQAAEAQSRQAQQQQQKSDTNGALDQTTVIEPLRTHKQGSGSGPDEQSPTKDVSQSADRDQPRPSQESIDSEEGTGRRRMRNTDSFYKDDSVETRKISLTPNLLKDENGGGPMMMVVQEPSRSSLDSQKSAEKSPASTEKEKEKEKKKEKKEKKGVLGGLFKRKNSKKEKEKDDRDDLSGTTAASPQQSADNVSIDSALASPTSTTSAQSQPQKHGKLQKAPPPNKTGSILKRGPSTEAQADGKPVGATTAATDPTRALSPGAAQQSPDASMTPAPLQSKQDPNSLGAVPTETAHATEPSSQPAARGIFSPIQTMLSGSSSGEPKEPKPEKVKKAKNRMALEDSESSGEEEISSPQQNSVVSNLPANLRPVPAPVDTVQAAKHQRLSESPVEVSPVLQSHLHPAHASGSTADAPPSPLSANSTPELLDHPSESDSTHLNPRTLQQGPVLTKTPDIHATPSASETSSPVTASEQPQWSPAALRAYLDADGANDVRDLILLVHDTSDVKDLPQSHELLQGFSGDRKRLDGMSKRLDDLLGEVLSRRSAPAA